MDLKEIVHAFRGIVSRAVVRSTNDGGETQTASVTTHRHVDRTDVEIAQPFGLASRAPSGGLMVVFAIGGDQGDLVGLPVAAPGSRLGNLAEGETAIYNAKGDRVHLKADGTIEVLSANKVLVKVKEATVTVEEDRIVAKIDDSRHVVRPTYAKTRKGDHWVVVNDAGIWCSVAPLVGPDPEPSA
ncbi:MAG TPA: phage baseplate assembly protein [Bosea sp. (in: a-proteobacteria)]|jgi:phage gp45-like|uniref:phage baseplate assembly protein n=1 Tax=Bosea sp. (in: a-proteobacteria) TaxID=1871050 RepID=UPI002DDD7819|nr:phage baseplate assembly protein [Bosea sp. (in: a-proteobacteria)]HEV2556802.1 phage baseplate assembly protein [Bosea sp. (in: a-proteobacteria)]